MPNVLFFFVFHYGNALVFLKKTHMGRDRSMKFVEVFSRPSSNVLVVNQLFALKSFEIYELKKIE